jgi:hypothetical protein
MKNLPLTMRALLLGATLQLAGCATPYNQVEPAENAWLGASYEEVVTRWGTPVRSTSFNDGRQVYTWVTEGVVPARVLWPSMGIHGASGRGVGVGIGIGVGAGHYSYRDVPVTCERTLIFKDGHVAQQTWIGPADFCNVFRRS